LLGVALSIACATGVDDSSGDLDAGNDVRADSRPPADASGAADVSTVDVLASGVDASIDVASIDVAAGVDGSADASIDTASGADGHVPSDGSAGDVASGADGDVCQLAGSSGSSCHKGTCPGCCDLTGNCHPGTSNTNCGSGSMCCSDCTSLGRTCNAGVCS
jgi:hypothetical protein